MCSRSTGSAPSRSSQSSRSTPALRGASGGYLGVSLFFTLSGFLMGMLVLREREHTGGVDVLRFWERRLRRLLPAAIATLAGIAVLSAHGGFRVGRNGLRAELLSALAYVANWRLLREGRSYASLFESPSPVQHFWSLSIEEQFYVFFPLLILGLYFLGRHRRRVVVIALATLCAASVAGGELGITDDSQRRMNDSPAPLRVLVVGDSTSLNLATGLANHARAHGDLTVDWAGQVACPVVDAVHFRMITPDPQSTEGCHPATSFWAERAAQFHPDVVVVFSLFMDAMDLDLRDGRLGSSRTEQVRRGLRRADRPRRRVVGAERCRRVVVRRAPPRAPGRRPGPAVPRAERPHRAADARWRQVVTLPLAAHVDGAGADLGRAARPDGIHFTMDAATSLADGWLVDEIVARGRSRRPPKRAHAAPRPAPGRRSRSTRATPRRDALRQEMTKSSRSGDFVQPQ